MVSRAASRSEIEGSVHALGKSVVARCFARSGSPASERTFRYS